MSFFAFISLLLSREIPLLSHKTIHLKRKNPQNFIILYLNKDKLCLMAHYSLLPLFSLDTLIPRLVFSLLWEAAQLCIETSLLRE